MRSLVFWPTALILSVGILQTPAQSGTLPIRTIYTFTGGADGASPFAELLVDAKGNLYGTTTAGGVGSCNFEVGCGVVFELLSGSSGWTEKILYTFTGGSDGGRPVGGLVMDAVGNLYGTTETAAHNYCGTVFRLSPTSAGVWKETTIYSFGGTASDGCSPQGTLAIDAEGNLFGTTYVGGSIKAGTVFELSPPIQHGGTWKETILSTLGNLIGYYPVGDVVFDKTGNLYATTSVGGYWGGGTVFELSPTAGGWSTSLVLNFNQNQTGCYPNSGLALDSSGRLYGTASLCGGANGGVVYGLTSASGTWSLSYLYALGNGFVGDQPYATVAIDSAGTIYGSTTFGGLSNQGSVFRLTPDNGYTKADAYDFTGGSDSAVPFSVPTITKTGVFGTVSGFGTSGFGAVYEIPLE